MTNCQGWYCVFPPLVIVLNRNGLKINGVELRNYGINIARLLLDR